ncbi:MAG: putative metalloprotease CJM1_0395 family protein [Pseudomonadota bacterium]
MAGLNAILARVYSPSGLTGDNFPAGGRIAPQVIEDATSGDVFEKGLYWKNRGTGESAGLSSSGCRCGNCLQCAARVYSAQDQQLATQKGASDKGGTAETDPAAAAARSAAGPDGDEAGGEAAAGEAKDPTQPKGSDGESLDPEEVALLMELKKADGAVRAHEQAHLAAAGGLAKGGANFAYRKGPDGRNYAVAGEVSIDTSKGSTPSETISRMDRVRAAALAPADPSPQDRKVAQSASMVKSEAVNELRLQKMEVESGGKVEDDAGSEEAEVDPGRSSSPENKTEAGSASAAIKEIAGYRSVPQGQGAFHLTV